MRSERTRARGSGSPATAGAARKVNAIGRPDASHERAAERMADQALAGRQKSRESVLAGPGSVDGVAVPSSVERTLARGGAPLDSRLRNDMEQRFGHDFANVRVHADATAAKSAKDVSANAYTVGSHIAFGQNQYAPQSARGRGLIAHELAHVVQGAGNGLQGMLMRQPSDGGTSGQGATQVAQADPCADTDPQLPSFSVKEEKERNAILQDMLRGTTADEKKAWCKKIRRALAAFSTRQMRIMNNAGVRFWRSGEFPAPFKDDYAPSAKRRREMARYDYPYRIIQGIESSGVDEVRHELAHAWDHVRSGKVPKLDKLKGSSLKAAMFKAATFASEGTEKRVTVDDAGAGTKKVKLSVKDTFDRFMARPVRGNWSFANTKTDPEHVTSNVREFYAEAYSVFHGGNPDAQADLLCDAPELYQLLEQEALADKLKVPSRKDLEALNQKRKCS